MVVPTRSSSAKTASGGSTARAGGRYLTGHREFFRRKTETAHADALTA